jgi:hypothetical protein
MDRFFLKKVALDFGRTVLGGAAAGVAQQLALAVGLMENQQFDVTSWKAVGVGIAVAAGSSVLRALQARFTNLETDAANR